MNIQAKGLLFEVASAQAGQRIDNFLLAKTKLPRSLVYKALRRKMIHCNRKKVDPTYRIEEADQIFVPHPLLANMNQKQTDHSHVDANWLLPYIIHNQKEFMVINKPQGLAVHGGSGQSMGMIELLRILFPQETLELVHRIDKETSGLILVAKKRSALKELSSLFAQRIIQKTYLALFDGPCRQKKVVEQPLFIQRHEGGRLAIPSSRGDHAKTTFYPLHKVDNCTLVAALPETGRMHQIRAHAKFIQTPIVGDPLYNPAKSEARLYLHAIRLEFDFNNEHYIFQQLPPESWKNILPQEGNLLSVISLLKKG